MSTVRPRTVSGMRPTGPLHLGHYFGVLKNWVELQHTEEAYFFVADWHALTSDYADPSNIATNVEEMVKDWVAAGLDPEKCVIFRQSAVKEHAELSLLLSMITPVSWLERNPTYKEQQQQITNKDLGNAGFLCYPVLMAADILMYRPHGVPVGEDQLPHMELTREIARRFNYLYGGNFFPEPQAMLTPAAKCPGLDGRKMSKSYNNGIFLRDTMADIEPKVRGMFTDPARLRKSDPGNPDVCNLFPYHVLLASPEEQAEIRTGCTGASFGCVECKKRFLKNLEAFLAPLQERRAALSARPGAVAEILAAGNERARAFASATLAEVRRQDGAVNALKWVGIDYGLARTGLAATDPEGIMAYPLTTIRLADYANRKEFLAALAGRILEERPDAVVMGLPLLTDGTESMTTRQVRNVTERLKRRVPLPFYFMSELLSSEAAERELREVGRTGRRCKAVLDQQAAVRILESFLSLSPDQRRPA